MPVANPSPDQSTTAGHRLDARAGFGLLIFAKAPRPGSCKTRLARGCGVHRAARLYRSMLEHTVASARQQFEGQITLICAPDARDPFFAHLVRRYAVGRIRQARGGLGQRMQQALAWGLRRHRAVVLLGSDQPLLADGWLRHARSALAESRGSWLAPTHDGGYWAIGVCRAEARVFRGPRWSTPRVARMTRQRLRALNHRYSEWHPRRDIDLWRDWQQSPADIRAGLARTAAMPAGRAVCDLCF